MILELLFASAMTSATAPTPAFRNNPVAVRRQTVPEKSIDRLWAQLGEAIRAQDSATALVLTKAVADHPEFASQPVDRRNVVTVLLGLLYSGEGQDAAALPYLIEASERPGATTDVWFARITSHARSGDRTAAANALVKFLARRPEAVPNLSSTFVIQLEASREVDAEVRFELRRALRDAGWRDRHDSWTWIRLIDDLIKRDRLDEAVPLVGRVEQSSGLLRLHAMRRYDELRAAADMPELDIATALESELAALQVEAEAPASDFEARNAYGWELMNRGRFEEALAFTDATLALPAPAAGSEDDSALTWTMDTRARLLMELGHPAEAIAQMEIAAKRDEGDGVNVSQTINLGWFYLRAGQNERAIEAVKSLQADSASPYGVMQAMQVRACAGAALGDARIADPAFAHMEQSWRDAPMSWVEAQACRGDADGAADTLLLMLADEEMADSAVEALHTYGVQQRATEHDRRIADRLAVAFARPDVIAARDAIARPLVVPTASSQF